MRARDVMSRQIYSVSPGNSIRHACQIMLEREVSGLPVIDDQGNMVGILTEGDLLRRSELGGSFHGALDPDAPQADQARAFIKRNAWCVADVMTQPVRWVVEDTPLEEVGALMLSLHIRRVPVLKHGSLVGIVSRRDLLKAVASVPAEPSIVGDDRIRISFLARVRQVEDVLGPAPEVEVKNGIIRLSGSVRSSATKDALRVIAESIVGAMGLDDRTRVEPGLNDNRAPS